MTTMTKKQVQKIIDAADAVITAMAGTNDDVHPDNHSKMCQLYDELNDRYATPEIVRELARIALQSLVAKPVAWRYDDGIAKGMAVTVYKCVADSWIARGYKATPLFEPAPAQQAIQEPKYSDFHDWLKGQNLYAYQVASGELEASEDEVINAKATIMDMSMGWRAAIQSGAQPVIPENRECISFDALMAAVSEVTGVKREFDAAPDKCHQIVPFMNFNSLSRIVEIFRSAQHVTEPYKLPNKVTAQDMKETFNYLMSEEEAQAAANGFNQCLLELPDVSTDTKRLNWLDAQNARLNEYYGTAYGWRFDANFQRNAMMLNDCNFPVMTVRQAIDEAMLGSASAQDGKSASTELPNHSNLSTNSPVIPDGWKLVPIEPTEEMIVRGFESRPDESFSKPEVWEEYAAMSGCKQAAHRAKLCWAAMLAAAPTAQESE
ncbi:hypothetical protein [Hafnia paralvei]|uniref:hypothetical protein n=1 Tax=Hafnia paralvei TaxID=546367 RepID=UPI00300CF0D9